MNKINYFPDNYNVQHKKVILRLDFNVPIKNKIILDDTRIKLCLPFINKLIEKKAKIIIISHLGRPKGVRDPALSLIPIYKYLKDNTPGKAIPVQITGFDERKLKITLLNSFTGFDLSVKDQVSGLTYTIDEKGYLNRPGNQ